MITKPLDDLCCHFDALEKACLDSNEPIFLKDKKRNRLVLMNGECYDQLIKGFDMTPFGIHPDIYEVMGCLEKILIYVEMTDEPIFVSTHEDKDMVFMTSALYDVLTGKTSEQKGKNSKSRSERSERFHGKSYRRRARGYTRLRSTPGNEGSLRSSRLRNSSVQFKEPETC